MGGWVVVWWCGDHIGEDLDTPVTWNPHLQMACMDESYMGPCFLDLQLHRTHCRHPPSMKGEPPRGLLYKGVATAYYCTRLFINAATHYDAATHRQCRTAPTAATHPPPMPAHRLAHTPALPSGRPRSLAAPPTSPLPTPPRFDRRCSTGCGATVSTCTAPPPAYGTRVPELPILTPLDDPRCTPSSKRP